MVTETEPSIRFYDFLLPSMIFYEVLPSSPTTRTNESPKKEKLSHGDLPKGGKITRTLRGSRIVFGLTYDLFYLKETHLLRKKSEWFSRLQKYAAKQKAEGSPTKRFRGDNSGEFDLAVCEE